MKWASFVIVSLSFATACSGVEGEVRTWTSADGNFQVRASLVETKQNVIVLKREDGILIEVPVDRLSQADTNYLSRVPAPLTDTDAVAAVDRAAKELPDARQAALVFKAYFAAWPPSSSARFACDSALSKWTSAASAGQVRVGQNWTDSVQAAKVNEEVASLISQGLDRSREKRGDDAKSLLQKAAVSDPTSATANCLMGLIWATSVRDYSQAKTQLVEARSRDPLNPSVLNNLAIVELRLGNVASAITLWQQAIDLAPWSTTVSRNVVNLSKRNSAGVLNVPTTSTQLLRSLETSISEAVRMNDSDTPWVYSPPTERLEATAYGTGFVVAPGILLASLPEFELNRPVFVHASDRATHAEPAKVIAYDASTGLLILSVEGNSLPPLKLAHKFPRAGTNIRIGGYLRPTHLTDSFRFAIGSAAATPSAESDGLFVCTCNQPLGPGLSPVFDGSGRVIGAVTTVLRFSRPVGIGMPASALKELVERHSTAISAPNDSDTEIPPVSWEKMESDLRRSVVLVRQPRSERADLCNAANLVLEDSFCDRCRGFGAVDCPVRGCANGGVLVEVRTVTGRAPDGSEVYRIDKVRQRCDYCSGNGKVRCPICEGQGSYKQLLQGSLR